MQKDRRNVRLSLASLDFLGTDAELREKAEQARQQANLHRQPGTYTGQDRTGSIAVLADTDGQVEELTIAREWRGQVGVDGVADALFEAYAAALRAVVEAAALRRSPRSPAAEPHPAPESRSAIADSPDDHRWLGRTWRTLHDIDADLEQLTRQPDAASEPAITSKPAITSEPAITSPSGCLTLRLRGGSVAAITGDTRRIAPLDAGQLRLEALSLLRAYAQAHPRNRTGGLSV